MKNRYLISAALLFAAVGAGAQNTYDALTFSANNYGGTARTMALGNAVTAVGGDLGTIGINPAGSAVAPYGQFTLTPGLSIAVGKSSFAEMADGDYGPYHNHGKARMTMPNVALTSVIPTGSRTGLKSITVGFAMNATDNYLDNITAGGRNSMTSMLQNFAYTADVNGYTVEQLGDDKSFDRGLLWAPILAYQSWGIDTYTREDGTYSYVAANEAIDGEDIYLAGQQMQNYSLKKKGTKNDMVFNVGFNFSDRFYLGFNLGLPVIDYRTDTYFKEAAIDPDEFAFVMDDDKGVERDVRFLDAVYRYAYDAEAAGVYAKMGMLWRPFDGLRIGAAVQSPTFMRVDESYQMSLKTNLDGFKTSAAYSPLGEYSYDFITPYIVNAGLAYTFGNFAMFSVDYEMQDNRMMKFMDEDNDFFYGDSFYDVNEANRLFTKPQHSVRAGLEIKPSPFFALRGGFGWKGSAENYYINNYGEMVNSSAFIADYELYDRGSLKLADKYSFKDNVYSASLGAGFSSDGPFFADFALRWTKYPQNTYSPYDDCLLDVNDNVIAAPGIVTSRTLFDAVFTLGLRF